MPKNNNNYRNIAHDIASRRGGLDNRRGIRSRHKFNTKIEHTNLQAPVEVFKCETDSFPGCGTGTNGTYIGKMHFIPSIGFMAGAEHSKNHHPVLIVVNNR